MADIALKTADRVEIVESIEQETLPAAEAITAGAPVRIDTASGKFTPGNTTAAAEARIYGIATKTVAANMPVTAIKKGVMDGYNLDALAYDADVHLSRTDGRLADAADATAGAVNLIVGRVIPGTATTLGTAYDKLLQVDL